MAPTPRKEAVNTYWLCRKMDPPRKTKEAWIPVLCGQCLGFGHRKKQSLLAGLGGSSFNMPWVKIQIVIPTKMTSPTNQNVIPLVLTTMATWHRSQTPPLGSRARAGPGTAPASEVRKSVATRGVRASKRSFRGSEWMLREVCLSFGGRHQEDNSHVGSESLKKKKTKTTNHPYGCGSKLNWRGKPQALGTMFPLTRVSFGYRFFEPQPCLLTSDRVDWPEKAQAVLYHQNRGFPKANSK